MGPPKPCPSKTLALPEHHLTALNLNPDKIAVKFLMDTKNCRVVLAEADRDFADILLSFLLLPLGTIVKLLDKKSAVGSLDTLYESVERLPFIDLRGFGGWRSYLLGDNHQGQPEELAMLTVDYLRRRSAAAGSYFFATGAFFKFRAKLIVTDDLHLLPDTWSNARYVFDKMGVEDGSNLEEKYLSLGREEILKLLRQSLISSTPLTDICFRSSNKSRVRAPRFKQAAVHVKKEKEVDGESKEIHLKLLVNKANGKPLCATGEDVMADHLINFLVLPLGSVIKLLDKKTTAGCVDNLYTSAENLSSDYFKSKKHQAMLLSPKFCNPQAKIVSQRKLVSAELQYTEGNFQVLPNLHISPYSVMSMIQLTSSLNLPYSNFVEKDVAVGETEVLNLLRATLTSKTPLIDVFSQEKK